MLVPGKLYDVHGLHIYGAGKTATKAIHTHEQIMYIHDWRNLHVFLADGDKPSGGLINQGILTRVKIPTGKPTIVEDQVMSQRVLDKTYILSHKEDLSEGMINFLEKSMGFAQQLPMGEKRDRYETMIGGHLYDDFFIKYKDGARIIQKRKGNIKITKVNDPKIKELMKKAFVKF